MKPLIEVRQILDGHENILSRQTISMDQHVFSGGEPHCRIERFASITPSDSLAIVVRDPSMQGVMTAFLAQDVLRRQGHQPTLHLPYLPFARQDRVMSADQPFSLQVFADLLNTRQFPRVTLYDPHSDVGPALIRNSLVVEQHQIVRLTVDSSILTTHLLVSPDAGAYKKVSKLGGVPVIGMKTRQNGQVVATSFMSSLPVSYQHLLIVDDICDGGRTFIELARVLRLAGAASVSLYVTHLIASKGLDCLFADEQGPLLDRIYTTDSFPHPPHDRITVQPII